MHKIMELILVMMFAAVGSAPPAIFDNQQAPADKARAQELLAQARDALGGDARLKAVQSLALNGSFRRVMGPQMPESSGDFEMELLLPDKYKRTENMSLMGGAAQVTRIDGFNGEQMFTDSSSSGSGMVMIRRPGSDDPKMQAGILRSMRADVARNLIAWLLTVPDSYQIEFTYAGEAESPEGKADVIDVKGADGFAAKLFLDKQTHKPLMLSYRAVLPQMVMRAGGGDGGSREDAEKRLKEIEKEAEAERSRARESEINMFFSDYKTIDGVHLPHRVSRAVNGEVTEEWEIKKFKVNPPLKAERFKK